MTVGDTLTVGTGGRKELVSVKRIISVSAAPASRGRGGFGGGVEGKSNCPPRSSSITCRALTCPTRHGDQLLARHALPSRERRRGAGAGQRHHPRQPPGQGPRIRRGRRQPQATTAGYQGPPAPNQWFGNPLSASAGSIALLDASGKVVVDAMVFGSQQSSSSANGTIASPELATLEGDQGKGGCIVVAPSPGRGGPGRGAPTAGATNRSVGRFPDGADTDNNCADFQLQPPTPGASNQRPQREDARGSELDGSRSNRPGQQRQASRASNVGCLRRNDSFSPVLALVAPGLDGFEPAGSGVERLLGLAFSGGRAGDRLRRRHAGATRC